MRLNGFVLNEDDKGLMNYRRGQRIQYSINDNTLLIYKLDDNYTDIFIHGDIYEDYNLKSLITKDGNFAFLTINDKIIFGRDPLGTKPLYYSYYGNKLKLASDPRVLENSIEVEPGTLYTRNNRLVINNINPLRHINKVSDPLEVIKDNILRLLRDSIKRRVKGRSLIGLSGIDSIILAKLSDQRAAMVCANNSYDHKYAEYIASKLNIELDIILVNDIKNEFNIVKKILPFQDDMDLSIGIAFHILARYAKEHNYDSIILGQLADELFGGYARYLTIDPKILNDVLYNDVMNAYKRNFLRDEIVTSQFVDLILPYTSLPLVKYTLGLDPTLKIRNNIRKFILREVAKELNIDDDIINKEKKAIHFSTGIFKMVQRLI